MPAPVTAQIGKWFLTAVVGVTATGCSWSRFSELEESPPVEMIGQSVPQYGSALASWSPNSNHGRLLILGTSTGVGVSGELRTVSDGHLGEADTTLCRGECIAGDSIAVVPSWPSEGTTHKGCFFYGAGTQDKTTGLVGKCTDGTFLSVAVPHGTDSPAGGAMAPDQQITNALRQARQNAGSAFGLKLAASRDDSPVLVARLSDGFSGPWVWFYASAAQRANQVVTAPVLLMGGEQLPSPILGNLEAGPAAGASLAVAKVDRSSYLIAVGDASPDGSHSGRVWLYRIHDGSVVDTDSLGAPAPGGVLCGAHASFGHALHSGRLGVAPSSELLMVSTGDVLFMYEASKLYQAPPSAGACANSVAQTSSVVAAVRCEETPIVSGCKKSVAFGASVVVADVDGDDSPELVVAAPDVAVNGQPAAGALFVYRVDRQTHLAHMVETRFLSSARQGDFLGKSLTSIREGSRDMLIAGIPGGSKIAMFQCSTLGGEGAPSSRCR